MDASGLNGRAISMDLNWAKALFEPRAVAVFGASERAHQGRQRPFANLLAPESGFRGRVVAVHPTATTLGGVEAVRSLAGWGVDNRRPV